jgi:N-acetylglucosamine-6-phosphate deacetylase
VFSGQRIGIPAKRVSMPASLFDIQVNGFSGVDFQSTDLSLDAVRRAVAGLAVHQTRRFFPTLITDDLERLEVKFANFERLRAADPEVAEAACGYHLEGPWLSPEPGYRGAHDPRYMGPPDLQAFNRLQAAAGGNIRLLTLAPEQPGSAVFIKEVVSRGVHVSLGHTNADEKSIEEAIEAGAEFCTHLGNGAPPAIPRHDNVIQRLLARDELTAFFIPDGIHLPPFVLRNFFRAKPPGRALFTTDCMAAAGASPGEYSLGSMILSVGTDRIVRQPGRDGFAGSALCPDEGVKNIQDWLGLRPEEAQRLFSSAVAERFGITLPESN